MLLMLRSGGDYLGRASVLDGQLQAVIMAADWETARTI